MYISKLQEDLHACAGENDRTVALSYFVQKTVLMGQTLYYDQT